MSDLKALREELRKLRKDSVKPVSRMKKGDVAAEIERLRNKREETPAVASTKGATVKASKSAVESIKEAKSSEFPVQPTEKKKTSGPTGTGKLSKKLPVEQEKHSAPVKEPKAKSNKMEKLKRLMEMMSDTDEE